MACENLAGFCDRVPGLENLHGKSVLITGATGLIGSAVIDLLLEENRRSKAGIRIFAAVRNMEKGKKRFGHALTSDALHLAAYDACQKPEFSFAVDYLIHAAGNAHPHTFATQPVETMVANFTGLRNLLDYALKGKARRLLYVSSSEVYGRKTEKRPYHETDYGFVDLLNFRACYPSAKRAAETLCAAYGAEYGMDTVIARPGHIYGPTMTAEDSRASAQFARDAVMGRDIVLKSAGNQLRSYCYGYDCAGAMLSLLTSGNKGEAYNISDDRCIISIGELAALFAKHGGVGLAFENADASEAAAYNLMDNSALTGDKLASLGWRAWYDPDQGVAETVRLLRIQEGLTPRP